MSSSSPDASWPGSVELTTFVTEEVDAAARARALKPRAARLALVSAEIESQVTGQEAIALQVDQVARRSEHAPAELLGVRAELAQGAGRNRDPRDHAAPPVGCPRTAGCLCRGRDAGAPDRSRPGRLARCPRAGIDAARRVAVGEGGSPGEHGGRDRRPAGGGRLLPGLRLGRPPRQGHPLPRRSPTRQRRSRRSRRSTTQRPPSTCASSRCATWRPGWRCSRSQRDDQPQAELRADAARLTAEAERLERLALRSEQLSTRAAEARGPG